MVINCHTIKPLDKNIIVSGTFVQGEFDEIYEVIYVFNPDGSYLSGWPIELGSGYNDNFCECRIYLYRCRKYSCLLHANLKTTAWNTNPINAPPDKHNGKRYFFRKYCR